MIKRLILSIVAAVFVLLQVPSNAIALNINESDRVVKYNETETIVLTNEQIARGTRVFVDTCSQCHNSGRTKTNPNVTLSMKDLAGAEPSRDNVLAMADYLKLPTNYDGEGDLLELHPNVSRLDIWPVMKGLTDSDLEDVSGFILVKAQVESERWGRGKVYD
ncbi:MAG: cytochrome c-550 [Synechococcaceae cyanobacterium RL_1_2]|nr:cytochrome c-550 [Synechococcaceae cyanobacterium RL_1_2]